MQKILVALHNYRPHDGRIQALADVLRVLLANYATFIIATSNNPRKFNYGESVHMLNIADTTPAKSRNAVLRYSYENGFTHTIILDDDIMIKNSLEFTGVLSKYIELLDRYDMPLAMFGYGREVNRVFGKPSPILSVINDETGKDEILLNRWPNSTALVFDNSVKALFREDLVYMDFKELISKLNLNTSKRIPFIGFFLDVPYAYTVFDRDLSVPTHRRIDPRMLLDEKKAVEIPWLVENDMDKVLMWINEK